MANPNWISAVGDTVKIRHEDRVETVTKVKPIVHWSHEDYEPFPIVAGGFMWRLNELDPIPPTPVTPAGGSDAPQATTTEERESVRTLQAAQATVREEATGEPVDAGAAG